MTAGDADDHDARFVFAFVEAQITASAGPLPTAT